MWLNKLSLTNFRGFASLELALDRRLARAVHPSRMSPKRYAGAGKEAVHEFMNQDGFTNEDGEI